MKRAFLSACTAIGLLSRLLSDTPSLALAAEASLRAPEAGIELVPVVASGLQTPLFVTHAGDGSGQLFVVEQGGTIRIIDHGRLQDSPFLDIRDRVWTKGNEQGLLGLAFHPDHRTNGRLFVNYNRREDGATVVTEFTRNGRSVQGSS